MIDLRELRLQADFSQADIAEILGISRGYVSKLERGDRQPDLWLVQAWVRACGRELAIMETADAFALNALKRLTVADRRTLTRLIAAWDDLSAERRHDLTILLRAWTET